MRPDCGSLRSHKWFLVAHSIATVLKAASITSELCSSNCGSRTKAKPCHETQTQVSVSLPVLLHMCFHDSLHYFRVFLFEGWFEMLPFLSTIFLACYLATAYTTGIRLLSSLMLLFSSFAQIPLQGNSQMDLLHFVLQEFEDPFFWGKQCPAFPVGSWRLSVPQQKSLTLVNFSCGLRFYSFVISLLLKKYTYNFNSVTLILRKSCFVSYPLKWYWTIVQLVGGYVCVFFKASE